MPWSSWDGPAPVAAEDDLDVVVDTDPDPIEPVLEEPRERQASPA